MYPSAPPLVHPPAFFFSVHPLFDARHTFDVARECLSRVRRGKSSLLRLWVHVVNAESSGDSLVGVVVCPRTCFS